MKKSLLALAILGTFAVTASAQSSLTIYGIADIGYKHTDNGVAANNELKSGQSASRIGFKGTEDLGNGLSTFFNLEQGFAVDTGAEAVSSRAFNRAANVGLAGAFGSIRLGRQLTPLGNAYSVIDPFGGGGDIGNVERIMFMHQATAGGSSTNAFIGNEGLGRADNAINYTTKSYGGFSGQLFYAFGEVAGDSSTARRTGAAASYVKGPLEVQFAYDKTDAGIPVPTATAPTAVTTYDSKIAFLGAIYNFGVFKLHGVFSTTKIDPLADVDSKYRDGLIGVTVPFGANTVLASYTVHQNRTGGRDDADSAQFALAYTYDLSKRTNLYVGYARTTNDDNVRVASAANGESASLYNVGIRHKF